MKFSRKTFLASLFFLLLVCFGLSKVVFMLYNSDVESIGFFGMVGVWLRGLPLDIRTACLLMLVPALVTLQTRISWRPLLIPYYIIVALCVALFTGDDIVMYEFWRFNVNAVVLSYAMSPEGATSSVSTWFLISRVGSTLLYAAFLLTAFILLAPKEKKIKPKSYSRLKLKNLKPIINWRPYTWHIFFVVVALLPIDISLCYRQHSSLMRNHAATNPVFGFVTSFWESSTFDVMPSEEANQVFRELYADNDGDDIKDTLLQNQRPNILIIQLESFSGKFVKELGGEPDVTPQLSRLIPQGVWFTNYYSNSFRTDRGTVSLQTGHVAHPTVSLMREKKYHSMLTSLPKALKDAGYDTHYMYAGPMTNMGSKDFVHQLPVDTIYDKDYFTPEELETAWGAHDGTAAYKLVSLLQNKSADRPWYLTFQTISSHEPWIVPYHRLADEKLNAFAYTDDVIGQLITTLQNSPIWDNLLVIIIPDHGCLWHQTYEDPEFFHSPMLWLGGAVKAPGQVDVLMSQSDIAATLLAQLGLPHNQFTWSRNVLSRHYTHPAVYCNYPAGIMLRDTTGTTIFDLAAQKPITQKPEPSDERIRRARALLQVSYEELQDVKAEKK